MCTQVKTFNLGNGSLLVSLLVMQKKRVEVPLYVIGQVCDDQDEEHRHPISNVIDGTNSWWQSPSLQNGRRFEWVTITLDLKQVHTLIFLFFPPLLEKKHNRIASRDRTLR